VIELLRHFRSVSKVKKASETALSEVIGPAKAKIIIKHYQQTTNEN